MLSFAKLSTAALALATFVRADLFITGFSVKGNATTSVSWTSTNPDTDPLLITVEIQNPSFHSQFAIGTTVPTTQGSLQVATPGLIPGPGYTIQLVAINNDSTIYAETPDFTLIENTAATSTLKAGAPTTKASSSSSSASSSATAPGNATTPAATSPVATTPAPTTPVATSAAASPPASAPATSSAGNSSSIPPATSQTGGDAAMGLVPAGTIFVMVAASVVTLFL